MAPVSIADLLRELRPLANIAHLESMGMAVEWSETDAAQTLKQHIETIAALVKQLEDREREHDAVAERALDRAEDIVDRGLKGLVSGALGEVFDPRGFFVYILRDDNGSVLYVGQSTNILNRLGTHMGDGQKRRRTASVQIIRCGSARSMDLTESRLIRSLDPELNIQGIR